MVLATNLGFPRIGPKRELKKAVESYWKGKSSQEELLEAGRAIRTRNWALQKEAGLDHIPSNDFSFYDQMLDMICTLGLVPKRYGFAGGNVDLDTYFAMARGAQKGGVDVTAMEMTKWFDTNYHYLVPELEQDAQPTLSSTKIFDEFEEAKAQGITTRPVLIGPITFLRLGKKQGAFEGCRCALLDKILPVYTQILQKLQAQGAEWVQIDEPCLSLDLPERYRAIYKDTFAKLREAAPGLKILLTTYFDGLRDNMDLAFSLPVDGVHLDLSNRAPHQYKDAIAMIPEGMHLSLGVVDGRNIWKNDLHNSLNVAEFVEGHIGKDRIMIAPSCSLLHTPVDLDSESTMDAELKSWLAFATQKLAEITTIAKGAREGRDAVAAALQASDAVQEDRRTSKRIHDDAVKSCVAGITPEMKKRNSPFAERQKVQHAALNLPLYPTTSIGSFPQTAEIRKARADFKKDMINEAAYKDAMKKEIGAVVDYQHKIGIDVLVHGEPERNDMVEYFGEQLKGFAFTKFGWVQSYGSRCVKPPIIFGDVSRPEPMTVEWSRYAQSLTDQIMKGMLTGPITILQWSFVRDDQPRGDTATQIALAIRDEVADLEKAGIRMIQIDEAAFREGLPLRKEDWKAYLDNAVENFRLTSCCVADETQIHTHMCYSEFNDVIKEVAAMDADVISIETSRSQMELLDAFVAFKYPNEIGPGVYDIHSPRVPTVEEMVDLLDKAKKVLDERQIWVNPDCGLKTRGWAEVEPALKNMVEAAHKMREKAKVSAAA
ncbi:MAG: 5-methyltetrahydropteroyltriglutamate--homocysteine S-methyltransferase [Alphaproteobacteria bacterium]|nr:5-methyltetrahydropteroyltriglutamate--homocysteine S-methyltransferase [Alphaproteobacteria bacterium]